MFAGFLLFYVNCFYLVVRLSVCTYPSIHIYKRLPIDGDEETFTLVMCICV